MSKHPSRRLIVAAALFFTHTAHTAELEEVVVTAQKREQSILDVPITISAFSGDLLQKLDITRFDQLADLTPGLMVQQQSINNNGYVIRGITSDAGEATHAARVSVYLNGTDVSRSRGSYFEIYDMERVEVVKGPQPTLFGTASSVGALSFITAKPAEEFAAEAGAGFGNYGMYKVDGMINGGNELVQGRFAFLSKERDGYVDNNGDEDDLNGYQRLSYRPSLRFTPNDDLTIDLIYMYDDADDPGTAFVSKDDLFAGTANIGVPENSNLGANEVSIERDVEDFNLTVNWDINDFLGITYIGAYREYDSLEVFDADGTSFEFLNFSETAKGDQTSHEARLNFFSETFNGFVGASYFEEDGTQRVAFSGNEPLVIACATAGCAPLPPGTPDIIYESEYTNGADNDSTSLFADLSWAATDKLELTAGLRWTEQKRRASYVADLPPSQVLAAMGIDSDLFLGRVHNSQGETLRASVSEDVLLPRLSIRYDLQQQTSAYLTISQGQRPEVVEVSSGTRKTVDPEEVTNYEVGLKGSVLDDSLSYTVAVYHQEYEDFRVTVFNDAGDRVAASAGDATNTGVEVDTNWQANEALNLFGSAAYIDAEVSASSGEARYEGNRFRLQPEYTASLGYLLDQPLTGKLKLISRGTVSYRSSVYFNIANTFKEGSVTLARLKIGLADIDDSWDVELFADNLTDEEYIIDAGNTGNSFGYPTYIEGAPRTYGLQARVRF